MVSSDRAPTIKVLRLHHRVGQGLTGPDSDTNFATTGKLFMPMDKTAMGAGLGLAKSAVAYL